MPISRQNFEELGLPVGPYTHAVSQGTMLFTSGFTAFDTNAQSGSAAEQTSAILKQLDFIARENGKSLEDLVKVTVFFTDPDDVPGIREALKNGYGNAVPASSLVLVAGLFSPELRVEIEGIFAL